MTNPKPEVTVSGHERLPNPEEDLAAKRTGRHPFPDAAAKAREAELRKRVGRTATRGAGIPDPRTQDIGRQAVRGAQRADPSEPRTRALGRTALSTEVERKPLPARDARPDDPERDRPPDRDG